MENLAGCITLDRRVLRHPVWKREPACYGRAWVDLIALANDAPRVTFIHGEPITLERGQLAWGQRGLAKRWERSDLWVRSFLKFCASQTMIRVDANSRRTIITILNYEVYNPLPQTQTPTVATTQPQTQTPTGRGKGKGELEREEGMGIRNSPPETPFAEIPSEQTLAEFFAGFKESARGVDGIPEVWWRGWVSSRLNAQKWPGDWQAAARMAFLADFANRHPKALAGLTVKNKKNGAPPAASPDGRTAAQARFEISRELEEVRERLDACHEISAEPAPVDVAREKQLDNDLRQLTTNQ